MVGGFGPNPVSLHFHYRGQTNRWTEHHRTLDEAIHWIARLPHLEVEKIVTPIGVHETEECKRLINEARARTPLKEQIEAWSDQKKKELQAYDAQDALEGLPGYGSF
jgi:hypothetical protein